jgi:hypothetical protein
LKIKNLLCVIASVFLFTACEKGYDGEKTPKNVSIHLYHPRTGEVMAGVTGDLKVVEYIQYVGSGEEKKFDVSFKTDSLGRIEFPYQLTNLHNYSIIFKNNEGIWNKRYEKEEKYFEMDETETEINLAIRVVPIAWVKINFKNMHNLHEGISFNYSDSVIWGYDYNGTIVFPEEGEDERYLHYFLYNQKTAYPIGISNGVRRKTSSLDTNIVELEY